MQGRNHHRLGVLRFRSHALYPEYKLHLDLATLLAEKGGTYEGFIDMTTGLYPDVKSDDPNEKKPTKMPVPKGASKREVNKQFKKIDPRQ